MSAPLPVIPKSSDQSFSGLLNDLLFEQSNFSAVESFSKWHENDQVDHSPELARHYSKLMPASSLKAGEQYAFEVDLDACSGCKACVVACHNLNNLEENETWRKVGWLTGQQNELPIVQHVTTACHHCVDPGCLNGCPVKAYEKDPLTGIVKHLDDQCFGCKYCTMMCPYEVPQYSSTLGIVRKCDMCHQRLANKEAPACVQACPNAAIRIRIVNSAEARESVALTEAALLPTAPPSSITIPTTVYLSDRIALSPAASNCVSSESVNDHPHEGHWPLVGMLVLTQASVGMWLLIAASMSFLPSSIFFLPSPILMGEGPGVRGFAVYSFAAVTATLFGVIGVHLALLHLGRPHLAYRAFLGWRTSWLSREAIGFGLYMGAAGVATLAILLSDRVGVAIVFIASLLAAIIGAIAVFCSAMIYVATRRSLWNAPRTISSFFLAAISLGAALFVLTTPTLYAGVLLCFASITAFTVFVPQLCDVLKSNASPHPSLYPHPRPLSHKNGRGEADDFSFRSGRVIRSYLYMAWSSTWALWIVALIAAVEAFLLNINESLFAGVAAACLLAAHLVHRWIYFSAIVTYRMPGANT